MKKIVALVLSLVMVLGLATTAFAAADKYDLYLADADMATAMKTLVADKADVTIDEVAAKTNKDGSGNVAYLKVGTEYAVKTNAPTVTSYAVCEADKTTVLYYVDVVTGAVAANFEYAAEATAFSGFGYSCGQVAATGHPEAGAEYYVSPVSGDVYKAVDPVANAAGNWLLNGKVVSGALVGTPKDHTFVANNYKYDATLKTNVPVSAICTTCLTTTSAIYLDGKAPAGSTVKELTSDTAYCVALGAAASTPAVDGDKVESAQTFDAGIAMYVGMSVMAAAGSAVVLKKKD